MSFIPAHRTHPFQGVTIIGYGRLIHPELVRRSLVEDMPCEW